MYTIRLFFWEFISIIAKLKRASKKNLNFLEILLKVRATIVIVISHVIYLSSPYTTQ